MLGEGLGQAVGQGLEQDRVVVVVIGVEAGDVFVDAQAGGDREHAHPVLPPRLARGDEVGQAEVRAFDRLVHLLAQEVHLQLARGTVAGRDGEFDVVAHRLRRPQAEYRTRAQPLFRDDAVEHDACIAVQLACLDADHRVVQDRRVLAGQLPGTEERAPVDALHQFG